MYHQPVLLHECIQYLNVQPDGVYLDATLGGGGHSRAILEGLGPKGRLIVFDQDADARQNLPADERIIFVRENFRYASRFVRMYRLKLHGALADLGVSSHQLDTPDRGFSIRYESNLDMRMDQRSRLTAAVILNTYSSEELQRLFEEYGEVTNAKSLAKRIVSYRNRQTLQTIQEFRQLIADHIYGTPQKYLAQVFQALRIEVNDELGALQSFLDTLPAQMLPGARMALITFHSLEDRIVKQWMKPEVEDALRGKKHHNWKLITRKPVLPSEEEQKQNPRSRSAKLRVAEKLNHT